MKPVPTIHSADLIDTPSVFPTTQTFRQPPRKRIFREDQLDSFRIHDEINSLDDLTQSHSPPGFDFDSSKVVEYFIDLNSTMSHDFQPY